MKKNTKNVAILALLLGGLLIFTTAAAVVDMPIRASKSEPSIRLALSSSSIEVGESMHAKGWLTGSSPTSDATIKLKVILPNATIAYPTQGAITNTDSSGAFSIDFLPTVPGKYTITASFGGDTKYQGASVSAIFLAVEPEASGR